MLPLARFLSTILNFARSVSGASWPPDEKEIAFTTESLAWWVLRWFHDPDGHRQDATRVGSGRTTFRRHQLDDHAEALRSHVSGV